MKEHILHVSVVNDACMRLSSIISREFGQGSMDHAIAFDSYRDKVPFEHIIDFRTVGTLNTEHFAKSFDVQPAPDDSILNAVSPFRAQTYHIIQRSKGFDLSTSEIERYYFTNVGFWESYLKKNGISLVVFYTYPHEGADFFIYQLSKALGIKTIINGSSLDVNRGYYISSIEGSIFPLIKKHKELCAQYADTAWDQIPLQGAYQKIFEKQLGTEEEKVPQYMRQQSINAQRLVKMCGFSYEDARQYYHIYKKDRERLGVSRKFVARLYLYSCLAPLMKLDNRLTNLRISMFVACLLRKEARKTRELIKAYDLRSKPADFSKKYVYFPLHYQPECTSNPMGGGYYNQAVPIRILSACLPEDVYLYVKEHPTQNYGARKTEFYDELLAIPRVVLIDRTTSSFELIKNCVACSSLTGTAGWETLFYQKPFLMFGYWVTMFAPGVYHVRTKEECKQALEKILHGRRAVTLKDIRLFFKAMDESEGYNLMLVQNDDIQMDHIIEKNLELFQELYFKIEKTKLCEGKS